MNQNFNFEKLTVNYLSLNFELTRNSYSKLILEDEKLNQ